MRTVRSREFKPTAAQEVILWAAPPEANVWMQPNRTAWLMLADDASQPVRLNAAGNERVSFQLALTPRDDYRIQTATLSLTPFTDSQGTRIAQDNVRIEWLRYVLNYQHEQSSGRRYPDALAPTSTADVVIDEPDQPLNRSFWISIYVPPDTPPGRYTSTAAMVVNHSITLKRKVVLEIFDFNLPHETHTRMGLFRALGHSLEDHLWLTGDMADFRIAIDTAFFTDMNSHQQAMQFSENSYQYILGPAMQHSLLTVGKYLNQRGLPVTCITPWGDTYRLFKGLEGGKEGIIRFWKTYYPILQQQGWVDQAYCRIPDEVMYKNLDKTRQIADLFHQHAPGVKIMVTEMNAATSVEALSRAIGIADIWCQGVTFMPQTMDFYRARIAAGEVVWPYIHQFLASNADPAACRLFFWMLQRHGLHGACYFCVKRARNKPRWFGVERHTDTFVGDGDLYYDRGITLANTHGLWRSPRLYRVGDGLEDREYFWLMNHLADQAQAQGALSAAMRTRVAQANASIDTVVFGMSGFTHHLDRIDHIRRDLADIITKLQQALPSTDGNASR